MNEMQYLDSLIERYPKLEVCRDDIKNMKCYWRVLRQERSF